MEVTTIKSVFYKAPTSVKFEVARIRMYGQPKLRKSAELKNVKQTLAVDYITKKCRCPVYIAGSDVWVKHRDYFSDTLRLSADEIGAPLSVIANKYAAADRKSKFIYEDAWGSVVLRNEAWICLRGLLIDIERKISPLRILDEILRQQERTHGFDEYELCCTDIERFWERVISEVTKLNGR